MNESILKHHESEAWERYKLALELRNRYADERCKLKDESDYYPPGHRNPVLKERTAEQREQFKQFLLLRERADALAGYWLYYREGVQLRSEGKEPSEWWRERATKPSRPGWEYDDMTITAQGMQDGFNADNLTKQYGPPTLDFGGEELGKIQEPI